MGEWYSPGQSRFLEGLRQLGMKRRKRHGRSFSWSEWVREASFQQGPIISGQRSQGKESSTLGIPDLGNVPGDRFLEFRVRFVFSLPLGKHLAQSSVRVH
jgi:hypothetical protein